MLDLGKISTIAIVLYFNLDWKCILMSTAAFCSCPSYKLKLTAGFKLWRETTHLFVLRPYHIFNKSPRHHISHHYNCLFLSHHLSIHNTLLCLKLGLDADKNPYHHSLWKLDSHRSLSLGNGMSSLSVPKLGGMVGVVYTGTLPSSSLSDDIHHRP